MILTLTTITIYNNDDSLEFNNIDNNIENNDINDNLYNNKNKKPISPDSKNVNDNVHISKY